VGQSASTAPPLGAWPPAPPSPLGAWRWWRGAAVEDPLLATRARASFDAAAALERARVEEPPSASGGGSAAVEDPLARGADGGLWAMNRNAREPRKANHGARPCSSVRRRRKYKTRVNEHPFIPTSKTLRKKGMDY
jgi:hypothetical protein